jgi:hypothetical protein
MKNPASLLVALASVCASASAQTRLGEASAPGVTHFGNALAEIGDYDGDGVRDLAVAASEHHQGAVRALSGRYMAGNGGQPVVYAYTYPGPSSDMAYSLLASEVTGVGELDLVMGSGDHVVGTSGSVKLIDGDTGWAHLCVGPPTIRTQVQNSGGASSGSSCTGSISLDFNAYVRGGVAPGLGVGDEVHAQFWSHDPSSPTHTNRTNALRFLVGP